jgi:DNA invertase Pin-like site-specific DNA recombinase
LSSFPAVDRLSRDTTDFVMIARDMQRAGAGLRSIAEPVVDITSDFAELVLAMLGIAAKLERGCIAERTARGRADAKAKASNSAASTHSPYISSKRPGNGFQKVRSSAASRGATTSVRISRLSG